MEKWPLVQIEWEDSAQPAAAWQYLDDIDKPEIVQCRSVGFLIYDGQDVKALAPNIGDLGTEHAQASGVIRIPVRSITRVRRLKIGR